MTHDLTIKTIGIESIETLLLAIIPSAKSEISL